MSAYDLVALITLAMGLWLGWSYAPRTTHLEGRPWFNALLHRLAPGRALLAPDFAERMLSHPDLPTDAGEGEASRTIRAAVHRATEPNMRWDAVFGEVPSDDLTFLLTHLGKDALPADRHADIREALSEAVRRRATLPWLLFEGKLHADLPNLLAHLPGAGVPWGPTTSDRIRDEIRQFTADPSDRVVLCASGTAVLPLLSCLAAHETLRDHVAAVVCVHGAFHGDNDGDAEPEQRPEIARDQVSAQFTNANLDTEMDRRTPWFTLHWLPHVRSWATDAHGRPASPAPAGLTVDGTRLPSPPDHDAAVRGLEVVDLGPVDPSAPLDAVALALRALVTVWATDRCEIGAPLRGGMR